MKHLQRLRPKSTGVAVESGNTCGSHCSILALMAALMAARVNKPGPKPGTKQQRKPDGMAVVDWKAVKAERKLVQQQARRDVKAAQELAAAQPGHRLQGCPPARPHHLLLCPLPIALGEA
jgi:hypothetical protein